MAGNQVSGQGGGGFGGQGGQSDMVMLWYLNDQGQLAATRARTGITDGSNTEVSGRDLKAGMNIIAGVTEMAANEGTVNPFQSENNSGGRRSFGAF